MNFTYLLMNNKCLPVGSITLFKIAWRWIGDTVVGCLPHLGWVVCSNPGSVKII